MQWKPRLAEAKSSEWISPPSKHQAQIINEKRFNTRTFHRISLHVSLSVLSFATPHLFPVLFNSQSLIDIFSITNRYSQPHWSIFLIRILDHSDRYSRSTIAFSVVNRVLDYSDRHSQSPIMNLSHSVLNHQSIISNIAIVFSIINC